MGIVETHEIMQSRWLFSFRFDRRGQTTIWELEAEQRVKAPIGSDRPGRPVRFEVRNDNRVWIEVEKELPSDVSVEEEAANAENRAIAFFKEQYPKADLI
jgi:hypothetical protein